MATITVQIGSKVFEIPEVGQPNWGEEVTDWIVATSDALESVLGPSDILTTEAPLINNQATPAPINNLVFDTGVVQQVIVDGLITRERASVTEAEDFTARGVYNGTSFIISVQYSGDDTGVVIDVDNTGQFTYTSSDVADTVSMSIKFKGTAIIDD